jgi:hypothetical protein
MSVDGVGTKRRKRRHSRLLWNTHEVDEDGKKKEKQRGLKVQRIER